VVHDEVVLAVRHMDHGVVARPRGDCRVLCEDLGDPCEGPNGESAIA
jgi:hypothetical protein